MTPRHCEVDAVQDGDRWLCPRCRAWKWVKPRDEMNRWRAAPAPRERLLIEINEMELSARDLARRVGKGERTVSQMLYAMEKDGVVESRLSFPRFRVCAVPRLWRATGKPLPALMTPTLNRKPRASREKSTGPAFDFDALLAAMRVTK